MTLDMALSALEVASKGGAGSGNWGHAGRPGLVGGSAVGSSRPAPTGTMSRADLIAEAQKRERASSGPFGSNSTMLENLAYPLRQSDEAFDEIERVVAASNFDSAQRAIDSQARWQGDWVGALDEWQAAAQLGANGAMSTTTQEGLRDARTAEGMYRFRFKLTDLSATDIQAFTARKAWMEDRFRQEYGTDEVVVYRGVDRAYAKKLPSTGAVEIPSYGLSSWTTDPGVAREFARGKNGKVLKTTIRAADVWLLPRRGIEDVIRVADARGEIVVINRARPGQVR